MSTTLAALIYRPDAVSERALSRGFAIAAAGHDVPAPHLLVAQLPGIAGWSVTFYASGTRLPEALRDDEFDHACELFEDEDLPPAVAVLAAAAEEGSDDPVVYAITYAGDHVHDDAWRYGGPRGPARRFVCEGDDGLEAGAQSAEASHDMELRGGEAEAAPHRGSTFLSRELGTPVLPALMAALYTVDRRVEVRLCDPEPEAIAASVARLNGVLDRKDGAGAFAVPAVAGVAPPSTFAAFAATYAFVDPADPQDLYRELALGAIEGTLRFLRAPELDAKSGDAAWAEPARRGLFPIATLRTSGLGSSAQPRGTIALAVDGEALVLVSPGGAVRPAGPTLAELLRYLELGWKRRSDVEEDEIGALMLRAHLRARRVAAT